MASLDLRKSLSLAFCQVGVFLFLACQNNGSGSSSLATTAALPSYTINCITSDCASLTAGNTYPVYILMIKTSSCGSTTTQSTVSTKGAMSASTTGTSLTTASSVGWGESSAISYGTYSEWAWVDTNANSQLDTNEPYQCSTVTVEAPSLGNRSLNHFNAATASEPALHY